MTLNYSVFYHDIMGDCRKAITISETGIRDALENLDKLEDEDYKDTTTILQYLQDSLTNWSEEMTSKESSSQNKPKPTNVNNPGPKRVSKPKSFK